MKALSVWQPWASLIMSGHKRIETRSWPAPYSIRGQRIAIAATKTILRDQRRAAADAAFREHYDATGLAPIDDLPLGCILGTVIVETCSEIDVDLLDSVNEQEE